MGVFSALNTGASGLTSFGEAVRVIGDNIANVNTLGFKSQTINFADVLGQTVNVTRSNIANQVGNGVRIGAITRNQSQGAVEGTTNPTDMAINGNGLFVLKDPGSGGVQYSRAGAFFLDKNSSLINGQGLQLQGFKLDASGNAVGNVTGITVANLAATAQATAKVDAGINLNASATAFNPAVTPFDPANAATYNFKSDVNVFDALGATHNVSLYFRKTGPNGGGNTVWDWHATVNGSNVTGGTTGTPIEIGPNVYNAARATIPSAATLAQNTVINTSAVIKPAGGTLTVNLQDGAGQAATVVIAAGNTSDIKTLAQGINASMSSTGPYHLTAVASGGAGFTSATVTAGNINTQPSVISGGATASGAQALAFNPATGALVTEKAPNINFPWLNAAAGSISFNFGSATTLDAQGITGTGTNGTIQLAGASATRFMNADGFTSGFLDRLETDSSGKINGVFTNGQRRALFQVALAKFPNTAVLNKLGNNMLAETIASGTPVIGKPNNGGLGTIQPFALEKSNVDLANEFVKLIVIQRAYEANSKTILTTDQMLAALMTLKR